MLFSEELLETGACTSAAWDPAAPLRKELLVTVSAFITWLRIAEVSPLDGQATPSPRVRCSQCISHRWSYLLFLCLLCCGGLWLPLRGCDQLMSDPASMMWSLVSTICLWDQEEAYSPEISDLYSPWSQWPTLPPLTLLYQEWASWCKSWPLCSFVAGSEVMIQTSQPVALWILTPSVSFVVHLTKLFYDQGKLVNDDSWLWFYILDLY